MSQRLSIPTPSGEAAVLLQEAPLARGTLLLGHGAGGSVSAPDLQVAARAAIEAGWAVGLVEQPYRVEGKRSPPPAPRLDEAWLTVLNTLSVDVPLVVGGRSSGARVACRTAAAAGAAGVLCLAFPLIPPAGRPSRLPELEAVAAPVLVVQGENDQFGVPEPAPGREVVVLSGDHSLTRDLPGVADAVADWLQRLAA